MQMPMATGIGAPVSTFATSAPMATPGQSRGPKRMSAASEMPDAGQTSVAKPATASSIKPSRATIT